MICKFVIAIVHLGRLLRGHDGARSQVREERFTRVDSNHGDLWRGLVLLLLGPDGTAIVAGFRSLTAPIIFWHARTSMG